MSQVETHFTTMGCQAGVWLSGPAEDLDALADAIEASVRASAATLTRFDPTSELSRLNADPRRDVPASALMRRFVAAARWAGGVTGGRVDATLITALENAGYATTRQGIAPAPLREALAAAPLRRPAGPSPVAGFAAVSVAGDRVVRPPGVRLDSGGLGKGLAADVAAALVPDGVSAVIAIGGDLAIRGPLPQRVDVPRAGGEDIIASLRVSAGGAATSGLHQRLWWGADGTPAHHILDPATGRPAWTGLLAATAVAPSALEAEVLAKAAFLAGPAGARSVLRRYGGILQHESGRVVRVPPAPTVRAPRLAVAA